MQEVSVNSTSIRIHSPRKNSHLLLWKSPFEGHSDLLDLLSYRFSTNPDFDATTHRFGEGTTADPSSQQASREGDRNHTNTTSKKVMIVPFVGSFHKGETIVSGVEKKDSIELYRYLFFTITYGENGMRAEIQQSTGGSIQVQPEDVLSQRFHVFIAFVSHPDTTDAIMLTEALGRRSVAEVMRKWLKNILRTIDGENYTVSPIETPDAEALKTFIKNNRWEEIRLSKKAVADENGQLPDYTEEVRVFKFDKRRPQTGLKMIQDIFHRAFPDEIEEITHSQEVDNFNPEMIKFKVKGIRNSRTFTVDRPLTGGIREILDPSVIDADGYTSDTKILNEFKRIFEEQHMPR